MPTKEEIRNVIDNLAEEDVSEKQQNFLASLIKECQVSGDEFKELVKDKTEGEETYSRKIASRLIEHLIEKRDQERERAKAKKEKAETHPDVSEAPGHDEDPPF